MDIVSIVDLEVYAHHGLFPEENTLGQKFVVSVDMYVDFREAAMADSLDGSIDYGAVAHFIDRFMRENTYKTIESVAEYLAAGLLAEFAVLQGVHLIVKKPWAPIGLPLSYASVEITRMR